MGPWPVGAIAWGRIVAGRDWRARDHCGQATKGMWRMSWRQEAMKGVEGCEKPGEAVKQAFDPGIPELPCVEYIGARGQRGELKHLSNRRKGKQ